MTVTPEVLRALAKRAKTASRQEMQESLELAAAEIERLRVTENRFTMLRTGVSVFLDEASDSSPNATPPSAYKALYAVYQMTGPFPHPVDAYESLVRRLAAETGLSLPDYFEQRLAEMRAYCDEIVSARTT